MGGQKEQFNSLLIRNQRSQNNILTSRSFPTLLIVICFIIIANTRCDRVGSANASDSLVTESDRQNNNKLEGTTIAIKSATSAPAISSNLGYDPLSSLREIYLDHNSKVISWILPPAGDSVQKFHPNGRYGRRSVNSGFAEPAAAHTELGKLRLEANPVLTSILQQSYSDSQQQATSSGTKYNNNNNNNNNNRYRPYTKSPMMQMGSGAPTTNEINSDSLFDELANYELEVNKLLRCNYTGVASLYWCDHGN